MRYYCSLAVCSLVLMVSFSPSLANDGKITGADQQADKPSVKVYLKVKKKFADGKHQTLSVDLFERQSGEKKRIEGGGMGDLFVEIVPHLITDTDQVANLEKLKSIPESNDRVHTFRLSNAAAEDVAQSLNKYYENERTEDGKQLGPTIQSEPVANSLIVSVNSSEQLDQLRTMIAVLDERPPMFRASLVIGKKARDGSITYISRPSVITTENSLSRVKLGENANECLEIDVTMRQSYK